MSAETFVHTVTSLGPASFPGPVRELVQGLDWNAAGPETLARHVERELGVERVPSYFSTVVDGRDWGDLLDRQLLATICTFLHAEREADVDYEELGTDTDQYIQFVVAQLPDDRAISLIYPGYKNRFDYDLRVDDWYPDAETAQSPRHWHLFSDFFWKYKQTRVLNDRKRAAKALRDAVTAARDGHPPASALSDVPPDAFTVGRRLPVLFGILPWFFIEEDLNYPEAHYQGKEMPYEVLDRLAALPTNDYEPTGDPTCAYGEPENGRYRAYHEIMDELPNYNTDIQDNCDIIRTVHAIRSSCPTAGPG